MRLVAYLSVLSLALAGTACKDVGMSGTDDAAPPRTDVATTATGTGTQTTTEEPTTTTTDTKTTSPTVTATATDTATASSTATASDTATATDTDTATDTATESPTATATDTATDTATEKPTATATATATYPAIDTVTFCSGGAPRMVVNGTEATPTVRGKVLTVDGGKGGEFQVASSTFEQPIAVSWQAQSGAFSSFANVDLASAPSGWSFRVVAGCTSTAGCSSPIDSYGSDFTGKLSLSLGKSAMYDMSLCLRVQESAASPRSVLHSLYLFVPRVGAN